MLGLHWMQRLVEGIEAGWGIGEKKGAGREGLCNVNKTIGGGV